MYTGKIYLKDSDKARLADVRIRIVKENDPRNPAQDADLVFQQAEDEASIPADALMKWKFDCNFEHEPMWFFTTEKRCKEMVSEDPYYWTEEKLKKLADIEKTLWEDWWNGRVYGIVVEYWSDIERKWIATNTAYGNYGAKALLDCLEEYAKDDVVVCIDDEGMKYEFENCEKALNSFG